MEPVHRISPCHLYKHSTGDGPGGSHLMKVRPDGIFVSGSPVIDPLDVLQGIQVRHFESGYPVK